MSEVLAPIAFDLSAAISKARNRPEPEDNDQKGAQLPAPVGYKMLCAVPPAETEYGNGLLKADITVKQEEITTTVLFVMKMGDMAYKDTEKFPFGAWCKEGDFILVRAYSGTRFKIHGREFRLINDDQVEAIVDDPRGIVRI